MEKRYRKVWCLGGVLMTAQGVFLNTCPSFSRSIGKSGSSGRPDQRRRNIVAVLYFVVEAGFVVYDTRRKEQEKGCLVSEDGSDLGRGQKRKKSEKTVQVLC